MKKIVITGVTSGIGRALLLRLNQDGHHVIGVARSKEKLEQLKPLLKTPFDLIQADLSQTKEVIKAAQKIQKEHDLIDVLINNAATVPGALVVSEEGHEMQFQVNHLAVVTMTHQLLPILEQSNGLIITTSSDAHKPAKYHKNRIQRLKKYSLMGAYSETKLYNLLFTKAFNEPIKVWFSFNIYIRLTKYKKRINGTTTLEKRTKLERMATSPSPLKRKRSYNAL